MSDNANATAESLPQASDAEISELLGTAVSSNPSTPAPAQPAAPSQPAAPAAPAKPDASSTPAAPTRSPLERLAERGSQGKARDYTGLDEEEKAIFEKMANNSYQKLYPIYLAHKKNEPPADIKEKLTTYERQLAEAEDRRWHDHPEAYRLSDEYREADEFHNTAQAISAHWQKQLEAVDGGAKEYFAVTQDREGNIVTVKTPVTNATRADLTRRIFLSQADIQSAQAQLEKTKETHSKRYGGYKSTLESIYEKNFKPHEALLKKAMDAHLESFPKWWRKTPEARLLAASLASNQIFVDQLEGSRGASAANAVFESAGKAAGPTQQDLQRGGEQPTGKAITMPTEVEVKNFAAQYGL